jgi:hypothetical protein
MKVSIETARNINDILKLNFSREISIRKNAVKKEKNSDSPGPDENAAITAKNIEPIKYNLLCFSKLL